MIRINLLPVRAVKKREAGRQQIILLVLIVLATGVANYFWYNSWSKLISQADKRIAKTQADVQMLDRTIGEVNSITRDKQALEEKLKVLDTLKKGRSGPVQMLDELSSLIPKRAWLKSFVEKGGAVDMEGEAVSHDDVAQFMKSLKGSKHFHGITLLQDQQGDNGVVKFRISCTADYTA